MHGWITAPAAVAAGVLLAAPACGEVTSPPFVDHTEWVRYGDPSGAAGSVSLRVYPTPAGRAAARQSGGDPRAGTPADSPAGSPADEAWNEVLAATPDADTPGMREQFLCHWRYAEFVQPGKTSWNLEPWRPVVDEETMLDSACNPGGREEAF